VGGREGGRVFHIMHVFSSRRKYVGRSLGQGGREGGWEEGRGRRKKGRLLFHAGDVEECVTLGTVSVERALGYENCFILDLLVFLETPRGLIPYGATEGVCGRLAAGQVRCVYEYMYACMYMMGAID